MRLFLAGMALSGLLLAQNPANGSCCNRMQQGKGAKAVEMQAMNARIDKKLAAMKAAAGAAKVDAMAALIEELLEQRKAMQESGMGCARMGGKEMKGAAAEHKH
ncbi:MAG: hypothetical protein K2X35_07200 [Bryobacteraceae bacterium]|nr:hypothetical protein [Bryobacteraceae bacterium]